jgi:hypothetical protein
MIFKKGGGWKCDLSGEWLPTKCEALSLNSSTTLKKKS